MNIKLVKSFIKDQCANSIAYFSGIFLIGLFYYINYGDTIEIIYPLSIALFVYLIWMLYHFIEYYRIYIGLEEMVKCHDYRGNYHTEISKKINETMKTVHTDYLDKLNASENNKKKERRFLSLWIHNMKTPVSVTDLLIQRLERGEIETTVATQAMKEENKKLLVNLDTVLNMIRLEDFAKDYVPEQINLLEELNSIINKNKSLFIYNHVFPKIATELQEVIILSDKKWNELMINQIISNAVKYSKDEEGASKEIYFKVEREGQEISLTIKDEGIGIPEHDIEKVCEPFFTGDNGRKGYQSSGIGLYFCNEVCKLLGHSLRISSEIMKGTSVRISYLSKL
ncbi:MAG TPA: sensor histidine kinase [Mobilitalea sp.]|nr:sensor histidine kinase [Mobilitalea sp.]